MIPGFSKLSENQFQITKDALAWITVLVAGADGDINQEEKEWAAKVTKIRGYHNPNELTPFYEEVGKEYAAKLEKLINSVPRDTSERQGILTRKLEQLNTILPLLENNLGYHLLNSYRSFAKHVAKASGGFLGFFSISSEEAKLLGLPMLHDIPFDEEEEFSEEE